MPRSNCPEVLPNEECEVHVSHAAENWNTRAPPPRPDLAPHRPHAVAISNCQLTELLPTPFPVQQYHRVVNVLHRFWSPGFLPYNSTTPIKHLPWTNHIGMWLTPSDTLFSIWVLPECSPYHTDSTRLLWSESRQLHSPSSSNGYSFPYAILSSHI